MNRRRPATFAAIVVVIVFGSTHPAGAAGPACSWAGSDCIEPRVVTTSSSRWEAEDFFLLSTNGRDYRSTFASGGAASLMWSNGMSGGVIELPRTAIKVRLRLRGDSCVGAAQATFFLSRTVDSAGQQVPFVTRRVADKLPVADVWTTYGFGGTFLPGGHVLSMQYQNNLRTPTCDRNLRWDYVEVAWG